MNSILKLATILLMAGLVLASCKSKGEKAETSAAGEVTEATGQTYAVQADQSMVMWEGTKVTGSHNGTVKVSEGTVMMDGDKLIGGEFTIDMTSLNNLDLEGDKKAYLESHLKGMAEDNTNDFFNVGQYPTAKFEMTKATALMNNVDANYIVSGNLTIKDVTKQVSFRANVVKELGMVKVSTPQFTIDRTEWGIKYGSAKFFDDLKDKAINDEMGLQIKLAAKLATK